MSDEAEATPRWDKPETWLTCLQPGCNVKLDPRLHSYRCMVHRGIDPVALRAEAQRHLRAMLDRLEEPKT